MALVDDIDPKFAEKIQEIKDKSRKFSFFAVIIKIVVFGIFALAVTGVTFYLENNYFVKADLSSDSEMMQGAEGSTLLDYNKDNIIADYAVIRVDSGSTPSIDTVFSDNESREYVYQMSSGRLWGNFLASEVKVNIVVDKVVIIPQRAVFDVQIDEDSVKIVSYNGDVYLGFLEEGMTVTEYMDKYSQTFGNRLLVPRDSQVDIAFAKIDERVQKLLYTKLVKEFKFGALPAKDKEDEYVVQNLKKDQEFILAKKQEIKSGAIYRGAFDSENSFAKFVYYAKENLTFVPEKKKTVSFDHLFAFLDDAVFYAVSDDMERSLANFSRYVDESLKLSAELTADQQYENAVSSYIEKLSVFSPGENPYEIFKSLIKEKAKTNQNVYEAADLFWINVYKGMDNSKILAEGALDDYYTYLNIALESTGDEAMKEIYLTYQNQLFDNLFLRYATFYKDGYFSIKNTLEEKLLSMYVPGQLKDELSQALISRKIDFLKRLRKFFFEGELEVKETREIMARLIEEVNDLMPADSSEVAVISLFESELSDIGDFWGYLSSPQYYTSQTYGADHEARYKSYLLEKDKIWSFIDIQNELLGKDIAAEITPEEAAKQIEEKFLEEETISEIEVLEIDDITQRYVDVNGVIGGYPFSAKYDRDHETLTEVYVYDELVTDKPVQLKSLLKLLQDKFADLVEEDSTTDSGNEELTLETDAERRARIYIAETVSAAGFIATMENVEVVDVIEVLYRVNEVFLEGYESTKVTFDFTPKGEIVTNVYLVVQDKPLVMDGEYTLDQLKDIITAENDFDTEGDEKILR